MARFWDTSAVIPLTVQEPTTNRTLSLLREDEHMIVWWGTEVEAISALARLTRERGLHDEGYRQARSTLALLAAGWSEVQPSLRVRSVAERLLQTHPLRAADAVQLASALTWVGVAPDGRAFVCLDARPREAAEKEGFTVRL